MNTITIYWGYGYVILSKPFRRCYLEVSVIETYIGMLLLNLTSVKKLLGGWRCFLLFDCCKLINLVEYCLNFRRGCNSVINEMSQLKEFMCQVFWIFPWVRKIVDWQSTSYDWRNVVLRCFACTQCFTCFFWIFPWVRKIVDWYNLLVMTKIMHFWVLYMWP